MENPSAEAHCACTSNKTTQGVLTKLPLKPSAALQKKFKELPKETVKQLQNAVAKNKEVLKHRKAVILTSNTRPYSVFVKENYRLLPESVREKGIRATAKALSEKWKRMSELQKQGYTKKADAIRKGASEKRKEMVKNYFS
eukprot:CAMPEP_0201523376 /NCGR_PEP_ID=MMETSP0161_2-20130828/19620_1 /ASSEMBLY_ACC=CAM_ASM_000251 /TAXON_ID=180227 /ORGANISM="Neoparamoeba aestuarina, Strain SoJaBio B1-5/56/2" /LENGTH=140 /DNA_ID=CAMNT_0047922479 /DNA_START=115 /DNA_END=536 /DNA_ORIENTATION=-